MSAERLEIAQEFSKRLYRDFGAFVKAIVAFGSATDDPQDDSDIDVLVIVDDVSVNLASDVTNAYRIQVMRHIEHVDKRLHVTSLKLSTFWELLRDGDPVAMNVLREGTALIDSGFFDPFKALLERGRIRPSDESIASYTVRAERALESASVSLKRSVIDLYWAAVDAAHAAIMARGTIPASPRHLASLMRDLRAEDHQLFREEEITLVEELVGLHHALTRKQETRMTGAQYDSLRERSDRFVKRMVGVIPHYLKG